ncbi:hypothetical protein M378DRAFT_188574 [Amanita muscaria Koide BX008]|uniref:HAT C-terminal dimerisation domain-containing protein n=1 Tax=Amanita muscaria (strain Koide BX008) TaxID=946122 RepID=A0A0C2SQY7_AMAMK|nr:hypothetical protein M378DRAFT_188574 [Amanita muscaria Koide BX008]
MGSLIMFLLLLDYIKHTWGGEEEQAAEIEAGNPHAKNWQGEAQKILESTMERYWKKRQDAAGTAHITQDQSSMTSVTKSKSIRVLTGFDEHRRSLLTRGEGGWRAELSRYLGEVLDSAEPDMDVVLHWQHHQSRYPTLALIALDILPCQASSVPCERLFSASKQVATDRRARLGQQRYEEIQLMKFAWKEDVVDLAAWNSVEVEEVRLQEYEDLLATDTELCTYDDSATA